MRVINPYLTFRGNCEEAFTFYKSVFGGDFTYVGRFADMPAQEGFTIPEENRNRIMHISLPISKETILMGSDDMDSRTIFGDNVSLSITTSSREDADRLYLKLSAGGKSTMPMNQTFWGDYYGMCTDRFGVNWMISFNEKWMSQVSGTEQFTEKSGVGM
jgi:PhnB protein